MQENTAKDSNQNKSEDDSLLKKSPEFDSTAIQAGAALNSSRRKKSAAAFRTISEVADGLGVKQHVLRFWETKFSQVKPLKRGGGRRYYRPEDIELLNAIHHLLYVEGYTIKGVQKLLREAGKKQVVTVFSGSDKYSIQSKRLTGSGLRSSAQGKSTPDKMGNLTQKQREALEAVLAELKDLRGMIKPRG